MSRHLQPVKVTWLTEPLFYCNYEVYVLWGLLCFRFVPYLSEFLILFGSQCFTCVHMGMFFYFCFLLILQNLARDILKREFTPKSKRHIFPLSLSAVHQSRLLWCELPSV